MDVSWIARALEERGLTVRLNEPMRAHTTLRVGGPADCYAVPRSEEQIAAAASLCRGQGIPLTVLGNGSNLLVSDEGIEGVTMALSSEFSSVKYNGFTAECACGTPLIALSRSAAERGLRGLAFAAGIPGTVGGALVMNAGAYGGEIRDVLKSVRVLMGDGRILTLSPEDCALGYRSSRFQAEPDTILLSAAFSLEEGDRQEILGEMAAHNEARRKSQPLDLPNAGSAFRRPADGRPAAAMIDACGLKGTAVGGAAVSEKHAGFIVNRGGATARDVEELLALIQKRVLETYGVTLDTEYRRVGGRHAEH